MPTRARRQSNAVGCFLGVLVSNWSSGYEASQEIARLSATLFQSLLGKKSAGSSLHMLGSVSTRSLLREKKSTNRRQKNEH